MGGSPARLKFSMARRARLRAQAAAAGLTAESSPLDFLRATGYDVDGMASALRDANGDPAAFCRAMMGNQSMQQMMLGATRRSGSLEAALSLEQRDETWLVIKRIASSCACRSSSPSFRLPLQRGQRVSRL